MLDEKAIKIKSNKFSNRVRGIFKKYGLKVQVLDKDKSGKRPDYFAYYENNEKKAFVCECKYIASAGSTTDGEQHVSSDNPLLPKRKKGFQYDASTKIKEVIEKAVSQYDGLKRDKPEFENYPFVVALDFDFWADLFDSIPKDIYGLKEVSAVMKLEEGYEQKEEMVSWPLNEHRKILQGKGKRKIPPNTVRFKVRINFSAGVKFKPMDFLKDPIIETW